jgi:hypothetical protein
MGGPWRRREESASHYTIVRGAPHGGPLAQMRAERLSPHYSEEGFLSSEKRPCRCAGIRPSAQASPLVRGHPRCARWWL